MEANLNAFVSAKDDVWQTLTKEQLAAIDNIGEDLRHVQSPVQSLEHSLHHFVTFIVMPLFALTNAGVVFKASGINDFFGDLSGTIELSRQKNH